MGQYLSGPPVASQDENLSCDTQRDYITPQEAPNSKRHKTENGTQREDATLQRYNIDKCYASLIGAERASRPLGFVQKDLERMEKILKALQFDTFNPCLHGKKVSRKFLFDKCVKDSSRGLAQYSCSLFYFSGHGDRMGVLLSDGRAEYAEIIQEFNSSSTNKPKIFIFDCCRDDPEEPLSEKCCAELHQADIPSHTLVVFACMPDEKTYGDKEVGSFFTLKLVNKIKAYVDQLSFLDIILQVTGTESSNKCHEYIQNPFVISTLHSYLGFEGRLNRQRPLFHSKEVVMDHIETIGHGVKVLVCYSPDPLTAKDCAADQLEKRNRRVKDTRDRIARLALRLEHHGFAVFTDILKGGEDSGQLLKWYVNHIKSDDFVLVVCSQAFKELCQMDTLEGVSDWQAKLVYGYCNNIYGYHATEPDCRKFIPVVIDPTCSDSVPAVFRGCCLFNVTDEKGFNYDSDPCHFGFDALVCRMAGIDRAKIERNSISGQIQTITGEGAMCMNDPEPELDITSYLTLKPGYKFVSPGQQSKTSEVPRLVQLTRVPLPQESSLPAPPLPLTSPLHSTSSPSSSQSALANTQVSDQVATLPNSPVNGTVFLWLCANIVKWKFVARFLNMSEPDIADSEALGPGDLKEQCYQMLLLWKKRNPQGTYRDIGAAIAQSSKNSHLLGGYVEEVQKLLNGHEHMDL